MAYEEEGESVPEASPLAIGAGEVESAGGKAKCPWVFLEVLSDI